MQALVDTKNTDVICAVSQLMTDLGSDSQVLMDYIRNTDFIDTSIFAFFCDVN